MHYKIGGIVQFNRTSINFLFNANNLCLKNTDVGITAVFLSHYTKYCTIFTKSLFERIKHEIVLQAFLSFLCQYNCSEVLLYPQLTNNSGQTGKRKALIK